MRDRQVVLETLESRYTEKRHSDNMFFGFVHPEATLMGLLNHFTVQAGPNVGFLDAQMQQIVQPVGSFHSSCIPKLTFRGGGGSWGWCDCSYPEVLLVL